MAKKKQRRKQASRAAKPTPKLPGFSAAQEKAIAAGLAKRVLIEREFPSNHAPVFSNHFVVHHEEGLFRLFFFNMTPPLIPTDDVEEAKRYLDALERIPARCVAEVIMSSDHMSEVLKALGTNFQKVQASASEIATPSGHVLNGGRPGITSQ